MSWESRQGDELDRLRKAFSGQEWTARDGECPNTEKLWASAMGELDPAGEEAVILHLARCAPCASSWRLAREMIAPIEDAPASHETVVRRGRAWWRGPGALAAAAALLIGMGLGTLLFRRGEHASRPVYREQAQTTRIVALPATRAVSRAACRLQWKGGPEGSRYDLTVTGENLESICIVKALTAPEYTVPADHIPPATHEILWRVTAHLPAGEILRSGTFRSRLAE